MVGWHHWFNGHELGWTSGDGEGQRGLACCSPWGHRIRNNLATKQQHKFSLKVQKEQSSFFSGNTNFGGEYLCGNV